jgi:hypothetical protein
MQFRLLSAAALAAVLLSATIPAMASAQSRALALYVACRAYGQGRMPLDRFVDAVERFDHPGYRRLRFWLLLCGGT